MLRANKFVNEWSGIWDCNGDKVIIAYQDVAHIYFVTFYKHQLVLCLRFVTKLRTPLLCSLFHRTSSGGSNAPCDFE